MKVALAYAFIVWDIKTLIEDWTNNDKAVDSAREIIEEIEKSIQQLNELKAAIENELYDFCFECEHEGPKEPRGSIF